MSEVDAPVRFTFDPVTRIRVATFLGSMGAVDIRVACDRHFNDPGYRDDVHELVDLRGTTHIELSVDDLRALMDRYMPFWRRGPRTRIAVVASSPLIYGLARMFELLGGETFPKEIGVFRDIEVATAWLRERR